MGVVAVVRVRAPTMAASGVRCRSEYYIIINNMPVGF